MHTIALLAIGFLGGVSIMSMVMMVLNDKSGD